MIRAAAWTATPPTSLPMTSTSPVCTPMRTSIPVSRSASRMAAAQRSPATALRKVARKPSPVVFTSEPPKRRSWARTSRL